MLVEIRNISKGGTWLRIVGPRVDITKEYYSAQPNTVRKKTIKEHTGKVTKVCIKFAGRIVSINTPATHLDVCQRCGINIDEVEATGWILDNGNTIWR